MDKQMRKVRGANKYAASLTSGGERRINYILSYAVMQLNHRRTKVRLCISLPRETMAKLARIALSRSRRQWTSKSAVVNELIEKART